MTSRRTFLQTGAFAVTAGVLGALAGYGLGQTQQPMNSMPNTSATPTVRGSL